MDATNEENGGVMLSTFAPLSNSDEYRCRINNNFAENTTKKISSSSAAHYRKNASDGTVETEIQMVQINLGYDTYDDGGAPREEAAQLNAASGEVGLSTRGLVHSKAQIAKPRRSDQPQKSKKRANKVCSAFICILTAGVLLAVLMLVAAIGYLDLLRITCNCTRTASSTNDLTNTNSPVLSPFPANSSSILHPARVGGDHNATITILEDGLIGDFSHREEVPDSFSGGTEIEGSGWEEVDEHKSR